MEMGERERRAFRRVLPQYVAYTAMHVVLSPFLGIRGILRAKKRVYDGMVLRCLLGGSKPPARKRWVLIVAGGLGEVRVGARVAEELHDRLGVPVHLLTKSWVGLDTKLTRFSPGIDAFNNPISSWLLLRRWRPRAIFVVEFWDNHHMKMQAAAMGIPTIVFNVPIKEEAVEEVLAKPKTWWRWLPVGLYAVQHERHRDRLLRFDIPEESIDIVGPLGIGVPSSGQSAEEVAARWREALGLTEADTPVIVAGSTWPVEETEILRVFRQLREEFPQAVLVMAPRRLEDRESVVASEGVAFVRRSEGVVPLTKDRVILLDTVGELRDIYSIATVAFVGGTIDPSIGGHTPVEALAWKVPVTTGPHYSQQSTLIEYLQERGCAFRAESGDELLPLWGRLCRDPAAREDAARNARAVLDEQDGKVAAFYRSLGLSEDPD